MRRLPRLVAETRVGKEVVVEVWRRGELVELEVELGELPEDDRPLASAAPRQPRAPTQSLAALGLTLAPMSEELREDFSLGAAAQGVVVTEVAAGSPAADKGIRAGDVIVEVSQEEVGSAGRGRREGARGAGVQPPVGAAADPAGEDLRFVALRLDNG